MTQIYGLYDPTEPGAPRIRYVGYTGFSIERRLIEHVSDANRGLQNHRCNWIRSLLECGVRPAIMMLEIVTDENWQARERHWIQTLRPQLTNTTDGGEGLVNPTQDVRDRISKKVSVLLMNNNRREGKSHTADDRRRISEGLLASEKVRALAASRKGIAMPALTEAARLANTGRPKSLEHREKIRVKAVGNKGRTGKPLTAEHGAKIAAAQIGNKRALGSVRSEYARRKISESKIGKRWITNGVESKHMQGDVIPDGWRLGRTQRKKE